MSLKIVTRPESGISLEQFIEWIEANIDFRDPESLRVAAQPLRALAQNARFLGDWMLQAHHQQGEQFQAGNFYNYQSLVLRVTSDYLLRANFWQPEHAVSKLSHHERLAFGYGIPHNHNFHLLTVGYCGSGYLTDHWQWDDPWTDRAIGEAADLQFVARERLATGDVMFYRAFEDVHSQIAPETLSVSLNLMTHTRRDTVPQYMLCAQARSVAALVGSPIDARLHLADLARPLLPELTVAYLSEVAAADPSPRIRRLAEDALQRRFIGIDRPFGRVRCASV